MDPIETARPPITRRRLILSLLGVMAVFALSSVLAGLARGQGLLPRDTLPAALLAYAINFVVFAGATYLLFIRPGLITWAELGIAPPRWRWLWLLLAAGVAILLLPARMVAGAVVQWLFGGFEAMQNRVDLLAGELSWGRFVVTLIGAGLLAPLSEELFFRGFLYTALRRHLRLWPAAIVSALVFGAGHYDAAGVAVAAAIMGLALALVYEYTHSLWTAIAVHAINNTLAVLLIYGLMALSRWLGM